MYIQTSSGIDTNMDNAGSIAYFMLLDNLGTPGQDAQLAQTSLVEDEHDGKEPETFAEGFFVNHAQVILEHHFHPVGTKTTPSEAPPLDTKVAVKRGRNQLEGTPQEWGTPRQRNADRIPGDEDQSQLMSDFELRRKFLEKAKLDLDCVGDGDVKPMADDPRALWEAYVATGVQRPAPTDRSRFPQLGDKPLCRINVTRFRELHRSHCSLCKGLGDHAGALHPDCYGKGIAHGLEYGFHIPVRPGATPRHGKKWRPKDAEDQRLLDNRSKEEEWEARIPLSQTPWAEKDVWIASPFVTRKKVFEFIDRSKPRLVVGFHDSVNLDSIIPSFTVTTMYDILHELQLGDSIGAVDLSSAYLQIPVAPESWKYLGVYGSGPTEGEIEVYTKLPFGLGISPLIFCMVTAEVTLMLRAQNLRAFNFYDDFHALFSRTRIRLRAEEPPQPAAPTKELDDFTKMRTTFTELHLICSDNKEKLPEECAVVLGIVIDLATLTVSVKAELLDATRKILSEAARRAFTVAEVRSLTGRLSFISQVIPEARLYMRGLYVAQACAETLEERYGRGRRVLRLYGANSPKTTKEDLAWWEEMLGQLDKQEATGGSSHPGKGQEGKDKRPPRNSDPSPFSTRLLLGRPMTTILCDASLEGGAAALHGNTAYTVPASHPAWRSFFLNTVDAELLAACLPLLCHPEVFQGKLVVCRIDNAGAVFTLNRLRPKRHAPLQLMRHIAKLQSRFDFALVGSWTPREENGLADALSHCPNLTLEETIPFGIHTVPGSLRRQQLSFTL